MSLVLRMRTFARERLRNFRLLAAASIVIPIAMLAACSSKPEVPAPATVTLQTADAAFGTYLTDASGRALYMWDAERSGNPTCYGDCAVDWPPLLVAEAAVAGPGVDANLIGTVPRRDGSLQVTYGGWPLYYFAPDTAPGDLAGQGDVGFGTIWWVVAPDGKPLPSSS